MASGGYRFERFTLDPADRRLTRDDSPVELNARYLDALALLLRDAGKLVSKDRFLDEVWRGVPVTDEALTQCIKTLRRQLGDDAASPRFIETVPKHGYRFIAPVEPIDGERESEAAGAARSAAEASPAHGWREFLLIGLAGTTGGGAAGAIGGLVYGFAGASQPLEPGIGAASVLVVLLCITTLVALTGAAGVGIGIAAGFKSGRFGLWAIAGGGFGGLIVGAVVKILGVDAFNLLFGQSPGDITGAAEGALLGGAAGLGAWLGSRGDGFPRLRQSVAFAVLAGGAAGILIASLGGRLMGGSLDLLASRFPDSRLSLDPIGALFGETGFGPVTQTVTGGLEGGLFAGCIVGAMIIAWRRIENERLAGTSRSHLAVNGRA
ncbi:MAG: winged helix-turn-helix domain-containing protein [Sphingomicrobium sp.]